MKVEQFNIQSGLTVYLEGDVPVKGLYVVQKGCIKECYIDKKGQKEISHTAKNGEIFGHKYFNASKHLFSSVAVENSTIYLINESTLSKICNNNPELSLQLIYFFNDELNKSDKRYTL